MARVGEPLTDKLIQRLKVGERKTDGRCSGLIIERIKTGELYWRFKFQHDTKGDGSKNWTMRSFGTYPETTLEGARDLAATIKAALLRNMDPDMILKAEKTKIVNRAEQLVEDYGERFELVYKKWLEAKKMSDDWSARSHHVAERRMENYILPHWKDVGIKTLKAPDIIERLKVVYAKTPETSHRVYHLLKDLWRFASLHEFVEKNIVLDIQPGKDIGKSEGKHLGAITSPEELGRFLEAASCYTGEVTKIAMFLSAHIFLRSTELRTGTWSEVDFERNIWTVPAQRMKTKRSHVVPLSRQVVELLKELRKYKVENSDLMFPSPNCSTRPISEMTIITAIKRVGFPEVTQHGFRATFRTLGDERLRFPIDIIEHQLAHNVRDALGTSYNRTQKLEERVVMMQAWSDYLDGLYK